MMGIGRRNVRMVRTDGEGRMDPAELERTMEEDLAGGARPVMIIATAGTPRSRIYLGP